MQSVFFFGCNLVRKALEGLQRVFLLLFLPVDVGALMKVSERRCHAVRLLIGLSAPVGLSARPSALGPCCMLYVVMLQSSCIMVESESTPEREEESQITDSLRTRVFHAAKDGMAITLFALLADLSVKTADELLAQVGEESLCLFSQVSSCLIL